MFQEPKPAEVRYESTLYQIAWKVYNIGRQIALLEVEKKGLRKDVFVMLDLEKTDKKEWTLPDGKILKLSRVPYEDIEWDLPRLLELLSSKGLDKELLIIKVNERALQGAVEDGRLGVEEVKNCVVKVQTDWRLRADLLKPKPPEDMGVEGG